eukprot:TRINITY_DN3559_c0_g1_i2.p1 TRINITY_DN3559_c0_g1~~TRINITY_DN3559_c0_g1_i2.p1  ORF type:complete len:240 (-),score=33.65 TRINITY_DN3559_c0_g1_i2:588-1235(-)
MSDLHSLVSAFYAGDKSSPSVSLQILSLLREDGAGSRQSQLVYDCGMALEKSRISLGEDEWTILEQLVIAAIDVGEFPRSQTWLARLSKRFPSSTRVQRLKGMQCEAKGEWERANGIYSKLLEIDPADFLTMRRKACLLSSKGEKIKAIEMFVKYLQVFMSDYDVWNHLGSLYLEEQMCVEHETECTREIIAVALFLFRFAIVFKYPITKGKKKK